MTKNKSRLGRGLSGLLNVTESPGPATSPVDARPPAELAPSVTPPAEGQLFHVELSRVSANPHQPRRRFDEAALQGLAESLRQSGLIQPIVVRQVADDRYELVAGERRWRAAQLAELTHLPALLRKVDAGQQAQLALVENIHRADLNPLERALAYRNLLEQLGDTQEQLAIRLGEDRSTIANHLRLLDLAEPVRQAVANEQLSLGHAKLLAGVHDLLQQHALAEIAIARQLSVRALEQLIRSQRSIRHTPVLQPTAHLADLEKRLSQGLQMRVQVRPTGDKGRGQLVLHYASLDQFDDLLSRLGVPANE